MTGKPALVTEKPFPVTDALEIVSEAVPTDLRVTDCESVVFIPTLLNERLLALQLMVGTDGTNFNENVFVTPPTFAVSRTDLEELTAEAVAAKPEPVFPAAIDSFEGMETDELLLVRLTVTPPLGAAPLRVTVQASVLAPDRDELPQDIALSIPDGFKRMTVD